MIGAGAPEGVDGREDNNGPGCVRSIDAETRDGEGRGCGFWDGGDEAGAEAKVNTRRGREGERESTGNDRQASLG